METEGELDSNSFEEEYELTLSLEDPSLFDDITDVKYEDAANEILILNPIKVYRDSWIDENGNLQHTNFYTKFNPCVEGPYTHLKHHAIQNMDKPNRETLNAYFAAIYEQYFPLLNEGIDGNSFVKESQKLQSLNVVDFVAYRKKRTFNS
jgi:hypothetical protein